MIRYVVPAALAAIVLCAPVASQAQSVSVNGPVNIQNYPNSPNVTSASTTYNDEGRFGAGYYQGAYAAPMAQMAPMAPMAMPGTPPNTTWVQGHYNWDPSRQSYVWIESQLVQQPHLNAQWSPGHWQQTPTAWIWVDGRWN
jgi:hypothetical protein